MNSLPSQQFPIPVKSHKRSKILLFRIALSIILLKFEEITTIIPWELPFEISLSSTVLLLVLMAISIPIKLSLISLSETTLKSTPAKAKTTPNKIMFYLSSTKLELNSITTPPQLGTEEAKKLS